MALSVPKESRSNSEYDDEKVKIVVIGDAEIGKTCLLMSYRPNQSCPVPDIFNGIIINKAVNVSGINQMLKINLCDTGSTDNDRHLRLKSYKNCDIVLICFDILNIDSLQSIDTKWIIEQQEYAPNAIISLIGLKGDKRGKTDNINEVPFDIITKYKEKYNFIDYIETSALKKKNVDDAFENAIREFFANNGRHRKSTAMMSDDGNFEDEDLVSTHKHQWNQHLRDTANNGGNNDNIFNQYRNRDNTNMSAISAAPSIASMGGISAQSMGGGYNQAMSYQSNYGGMAMGAQSMLSQHHTMSYGQSGFPQSYVNPNGALMNNTRSGLQNVVEDKEIDNASPPPPPPPTETNKLTQKLSNEEVRLESIDYELDQQKKRNGAGCCVIM